MSTFLIPLQNVPQQFAIALAGKEYTMTCRWNSAPEGGWFIDLADATTGESIVANLPLITGADILEGLEYLNFLGELIIFTDGEDTAVPTLDNLGIESNLYFVTDVV